MDEALQQLSGEDAAAAEALILPDLPGKTYGQVAKLAAQAAVTVDPDSAARRRQDAERNQSRVEMFREQSGAAALAGRELPTDQALAAHASVCARAQEYKESGAFPGGTRMDQYRVAAYLDLLNGITAEARIATGAAARRLPGRRPARGRARPPAGADCACRECDGSCLPPDDGDEDDGRGRQRPRTAERPAANSRADPGGGGGRRQRASRTASAGPDRRRQSHARRRLQLRG